MRDIGAGLGSDVPVCVTSQPAFMEGRGEILTPVTSLPRLPLLLVNPGVGGLRPRTYSPPCSQRSGVAMKLPSGGFSDLADLLRFLETTSNDLEAPAKAREPAIGEVLDALRSDAGRAFHPHVGLGRDVFCA